MTAPGNKAAGPPSRHIALSIVTILLAPLLWLLFVYTSNPHELIVGVAASIATIVFIFFVCRSSSSSITVRAPDLVQGWRLPWYIVSGAFEITLILLKDLLRIAPAENLFFFCKFDTSSEDPVRIGRTVLAVACTTMAPNFIVIGIDQTQRRMLFHQIAPSSVPLMTRALGAQP
ncbi:MAG TPA: hypothetical protein VGD64_07300 [Acidisarcina sp.]